MLNALMAIDHVLNDLLPLLDAHRLVLVGVDGCEGAGKSQFAARLSNALHSRSIANIIISIDDFCQPRHMRYRSDIPDDIQVYMNNFDEKQFLTRVLIPLRDCGTYEYSFKALDAVTDKYEKQRRYAIQAPGIVIIEGIHVFKLKYRHYFDRMVMLTVDPIEQMKRAYARDPSRGNSPNDIDYKYTSRYRPSWEHYVRIDKPMEAVHWVIDNTDWRNPRIVRGRGHESGCG